MMFMRPPQYGHGEDRLVSRARTSLPKLLKQNLMESADREPTSASCRSLPPALLCVNSGPSAPALGPLLCPAAESRVGPFFLALAIVNRRLQRCARSPLHARRHLSLAGSAAVGVLARHLQGVRTATSSAATFACFDDLPIAPMRPLGILQKLHHRAAASTVRKFAKGTTPDGIPLVICGLIRLGTFARCFHWVSPGGC
jgi:hypothetical protein